MAFQFRDEDDTGGKPLFLIRPAENVYSYFMFIGPTQTKRNKRPEETDWDIVMAYVLVALNLIMQAVLLFLIFDETVVANVHWQDGVLKMGDDSRVMGLLVDGGGKCNDGGSLCFRDEQGYSCAPPSVQLTGRWDELDTDKDGVWTRKEVIAAQAALRCRYVVDPVEVFDVLLALLRERESMIWLHPEVKNGNAIPLPYFTYIMSDVIMCGYRSHDMCSNLIQRGFFEAPMKYGTSPRVGTTIDSALRYCNRLLMPGGACERNLPSTYAVWKTTSTQECGAPTYKQFEYTNPGSNTTKSLLSVDYSTREEYELAQDAWFSVFKGIVIFAWLVLMVSEVRDVIKVLTFCARMPNAEDFGDDAVIMEQDPSDPEDVRFRLKGITTKHRVQVVLITLARLVLVSVLAVVGLGYLIKTNGYADLIMNGVSLGFIAEVSAVLYDQILREEVKDQTSDIKPIKVLMFGIEWLNDRPALIDMLYVLGMVIVTIAIIHWQLHTIVVPVHDSLECACLSSGEQCVEAQKYNYEFWHEYWLNGIPEVFRAIAQLKLDLAAAPAAAAAAPASFIALPSSPRAPHEDSPKGTFDSRVAAAERRVEASVTKLLQVEAELGQGSPASVANRFARLLRGWRRGAEGQAPLSPTP